MKGWTQADIDRINDKKIIDKPSKYRSQKVEDGGIVFDSKKEAKRHKELKLLLKTGEIVFLARQVEFNLSMNGQKIASYYADFVYKLTTGELIVEDVKSEITRKLPVYRLKRKMMLAQHGIAIKEV